MYNLNVEEFFAALRKKDNLLFGTNISQRQVDGLQALLDAGRFESRVHLAHVLAEVYWETGGGMYPVKETVYRNSKDKNPSDATVIARLDRAWKKGQLVWVKVPYWREGFFGRGQIQVTHKDNYKKASAIVDIDLVAHPERALELPVSAEIAVEGCKAGIFTGKKLSDFDKPDGYDHANARMIVNGDWKVVGPHIVRYAEKFESALKAGAWMLLPAGPSVIMPKAENKAAAAAADNSDNWFAAVVKIIAGFFRKREK